MMITLKNVAAFLKQLNWTKRFAILICILFFSSFLLDLITEGFRLNQNLRWIYQYGQFLSIIFYCGSFVWSLLNSVLIVSEESNWKKKLLWATISLLPIIFLILSFVAWYFEI
ncbi:MAG: hypothetical protein CMF36_11705 [Leeuwenhoekiella sp.]|nr:hypothetical protein [Leeuwenhoekiella sp.]MBA81785.1 hypothetical protein [Leeuwenhoekiella sp.]|tara:strand:+ start:12389 stop:12727 length:339 start_codon:yes stop_codon:yes gene_type:complete